MEIALATGWSLEYIEQFDWYTLIRMIRFIENKRRRELEELLPIQEYHALVANGKAHGAKKIRRKLAERIGYNGNGKKSNFAQFLMANTGGQLFKPTK